MDHREHPPRDAERFPQSVEQGNTPVSVLGYGASFLDSNTHRTRIPYPLTRLARAYYWMLTETFLLTVRTLSHTVW